MLKKFLSQCIFLSVFLFQRPSSGLYPRRNIHQTKMREEIQLSTNNHKSTILCQLQSHQSICHAKVCTFSILSIVLEITIKSISSKMQKNLFNRKKKTLFTATNNLINKTFKMIKIIKINKAQVYFTKTRHLNI